MGGAVRLRRIAVRNRSDHCPASLGFSVRLRRNTHSPTAADRFTTELVADLHRVAGLGYTGANRGWIRPGLRLHVYGNFCAYFRTDDQRFIVLRIVRGSRDIDAIVFEPDDSSS